MKLVRNNPGHRLRSEGARVRSAARSEMPMLLAQKLVEEANEVLARVKDGDGLGLLDELGDVTEVIRGLRHALGLRKDDIASARRTKRRREGDFSEQLVWENDQLVWEND